VHYNIRWISVGYPLDPDKAPRNNSLVQNGVCFVHMFPVLCLPFSTRVDLNLLHTIRWVQPGPIEDRKLLLPSAGSVAGETREQLSGRVCSR
jgi:hypothetical protein